MLRTFGALSPLLSRATRAPKNLQGLPKKETSRVVCDTVRQVASCTAAGAGTALAAYATYSTAWGPGTLAAVKAHLARELPIDKPL